MREGSHPLLWVATENNMVTDTGDVKIRYAPATILFDLTNKSREVVMDASPWTYRLMADEIRREGKIVEDAAAGSGRIPDLRRFPVRGSLHRSRERRALVRRSRA